MSPVWWTWMLTRWSHQRAMWRQLKSENRCQCVTILVILVDILTEFINRLQASARVVEDHAAVGTPLCNTALWNRSLLPGDSTWKATDWDPALSPNRVTWKQQWKNKSGEANVVVFLFFSYFQNRKGNKKAFHLWRITTKSSNIIDHPLDGQALVQKACIATDVLIVRKRQEAKGSKSLQKTTNQQTKKKA